jgi:hypothetical protein
MLASVDALARLVIAATAIPAMHVYRLELSDRGRGHARPASNGLRTPDILSAPTKHRRHYSMPHPRRRPKPDRSRALELLASCRDGCTEAIMLAHGFTVAQMVDLVRAGLATATAERMIAGGRTIEVTRVRIGEAGRRALAGQ